MDRIPEIPIISNNTGLSVTGNLDAIKHCGAVLSVHVTFCLNCKGEYRQRFILVSGNERKTKSLPAR